MIKNRSRTVRAAVVAGVMALLLGPAAAAQAAVVPVNFNLVEGLLDIGGTAIAIPAAGATLSGDWDNETGDFNGALVIPAFSTEVDAGLGAPITLDVVITATPVVGTVPPDGTDGSVTTALTVNVGVTLLGAACSLGPVNLVLITTLGEDAAGDIILEAFQQGFTIPAAVCTQSSFDSLVNGALGLPTTSTFIELLAVLGDSPAPEPTPEPTPEPEAEPAVAATPKFTG